MSLATVTDGGTNADEDANIQLLLKMIHERSTLHEEYKIPFKAWQLLTKVVSKEDRDAFIAERHKALEQSGGALGNGSGIPK